MKVKKSVEIGALVFAVFVIITVISGVTYSYFVATINPTGEVGSDRVTAGNLNVDFGITGAALSNSNIFLIPEKDFLDEAEMLNFTVKNNENATINSKYAIYLTDIVFDSLGKWKSPDLRWQLFNTADESSPVASGHFGTIGGNTEILLYNNNDFNITLPLGTTHTYKFYIGLVETNNNQNSLAGGSISGRLKIVATP